MVCISICLKLSSIWFPFGLVWPCTGCLLTPLMSIQNLGSGKQEEVCPKVVRTFQLWTFSALKKQKPKKWGLHSTSFLHITSITMSMSDWWFVVLSYWRRHTLVVEDGAFSHKMDYVSIFGESKSWRASKSLHWFKRYGNFGEWRDFTYWWSCIGRGLCLQPAQQACLLLDICWIQPNLRIKKNNKISKSA